MDTVNESLTTVDDGDGTVNERLSPGGKGPEGQPDTATETIAAQEHAVSDEADDEKPAAKRSRKKS